MLWCVHSISWQGCVYFISDYSDHQEFRNILIFIALFSKGRNNVKVLGNDNAPEDPDINF